MTRVMIAMTLVGALAACDSEPDPIETHTDPPQPVVAEPVEGDAAFHRERSEFVQVAEARLATVEQSIDDVRDEASSIAGDMRQKMEQAFAELRDEREDAQRMLERARTSTESEWAERKREATNAIAAFEDAYEAARSELK